EIFVAQGHQSYVNAISFSSDNRLLASGGMDDTARLWDMVTGKQSDVVIGKQIGVCPLEKLSWEVPIFIRAGVGTNAISLDKKYLATANVRSNIAQFDGDLRLLDITTGNEILCKDGASHHVSILSFSSNGKIVASLGEDPIVRLWE